jgi:Helix-turn-helix domain/Bacterial regulatory proteins, gntR family
VTAPKYAQAAAIVRAQVADGTLRPGQPAPSGAALARLTGFSVLTCRRGLRALLAEGALTPGASRNARPRVAAPAEAGAGDAGAVLSRALAALRRAAGLTQPALAALTGYSVTTVGHAETGRLWQARAFWEKADVILAAGGELTRLHDAYRAAGSAPAAPWPAAASPPAPTGPGALACLALHWADGTVTTLYPPGSPLP